MEASRSTFQKRNAGFSLIVGSLRAKGYQREMFSGRKAHPLDADRIALATSFVRDVMQQFGIPGVGLGLIDGGKVVFEGGLGVKTLGMPDPVDADTLFLAASNTKAMTTLLLAEAGRRAQTALGPARHGDLPEVSGWADADMPLQVLVKHLLCACTGLPAPGLRVALQLRGGHTTVVAGIARRHAAHHPLWRGLPVQQRHGAAAGCVAASVVNPGRSSGRPTMRPCDREGVRTARACRARLSTSRKP